MTNPDMPLGSITDASTAVTAESFDVDEWLAGVRPTRRAVTLYARADLLARMDEIAYRVERMPDGDEVDALVDEFEELRAEFLAGRTFVVEGRSAEWRDEFKRDAKERLGVRKGDGTTDQKRAILLAMLAEQIVSPVVTAEQLERLNDVNAGELSKLLVAQTFANEQVAEASKVVTLDFSSRRSAASRT